MPALRQTIFKTRPQLRSGRFFHRTSQEAAKSIFVNGFRDGTGSYLVPGGCYSGVWISNRPLGSGEGANGNTLLEIRIPRRYVYKFEWKEEGKPFREFLVPAAVLNRHAHARIIEVLPEQDAWLEGE